MSRQAHLEKLRDRSHDILFIFLEFQKDTDEGETVQLFRPCFFPVKGRRARALAELVRVTVAAWLSPNRRGVVSAAGHRATVQRGEKNPAVEGWLSVAQIRVSQWRESES